MVISVVSDVHCEHDTTNKLAAIREMPKKEFLVLAGDIGTRSSLEAAVEAFCGRANHVIMVAGNHEAWGRTIQASLDQCKELESKFPNFHFLNNSSVVIDGQRFVGTSLWFPDHPLNFAFHHLDNDFARIDNFVSDVYAHATAAKRYLEGAVDTDDVVITHHLPSHESVHPRFRASEGNRFYVHDVSRLVEYAQPKLWIHGHTHDPVDYMIGDTRVICNPMGYYICPITTVDVEQ
ncbi:MAG: Metallophosphoesterase [Candidatus Gottesmanbacteria bacterium GW2011_GWB1_49_7]|uniref:Metallophosphoesterase n=1 Tax=Candidatus Gottesmanbacteria bacterium GW2011_GWB1_49_7 TaxID=1618448 RepID=A0A0G1Z2G9_9BACT|nr:MAG: Metallophosphoesterase [Candidatus Gottesmanbacteria bacterium GW2011_GWB1_49_7]